MRILIDIGHPAHVHYFKNFIMIMKGRGHEFCITARDKDITFDLLKKYHFQFAGRGKGGISLIGKLLYIPKADLFIYKKARAFRPDIFLSFASTYAAHAAKLYGKPHIALDDTEHAKLELFLYPPFTDEILTPSCFQKNLGKKQIKFDSYIEFSYLHSNYFLPDPNIRKDLGLKDGEKFVLFRYVSWDAAHDRGHSGISDESKTRLIELFEGCGYKVFISSEGRLIQKFEPYRLRISSEKIHDVLHECNFFIGESGTMATEACILGTPSVFVNSLNAGVFDDEVQYGLLYKFNSSIGLISKVQELLADKFLEQKHHARRKKLVEDKIDITALLVWFIENYPKSPELLKLSPDYQNRFRSQTIEEVF